MLNPPPPKYAGHVPLTVPQKMFLCLGSGIGAFLDPRRADLVGIFGELTGDGYFIRRIRDQMLSDETGRRILRDRPRITSKSMPIDQLKKLPLNTVGRSIADWRIQHGMSADKRDSVQYIDDDECAYVMQRYRECHDIVHSVLGIPGAFVEGEVALKGLEFMNTWLPMTGLSLLAAVKLKPEEMKRLWNIYGPWAIKNGLNSTPIINVYWEEELSTDVDTLLTRLGIEKPPDLRDMRRKERLEKRAKNGAGNV